jgi:hypothetical protein
MKRKLAKIVIDKARSVIPEFVVGNTIEIPADILPSYINARLNRVGLEAISRFPGISAPMVRVMRTTNKVPEFKPFMDELGWPKAFRDKWRDFMTHLPLHHRKVMKKKKLKDPTSWDGARYQRVMRCADVLGDSYRYMVNKQWSMLVRREGEGPAQRLGWRRFAMTSIFSPAPNASQLAEAGASYIRERLREVSFVRKILPP